VTWYIKPGSLWKTSDLRRRQGFAKVLGGALALAVKGLVMTGNRETVNAYEEI
jgi:hypothetical protein